jgi:hypothetical protein
MTTKWLRSHGDGVARGAPPMDPSRLPVAMKSIVAVFTSSSTSNSSLNCGTFRERASLTPRMWQLLRLSRRVATVVQQMRRKLLLQGIPSFIGPRR